MTWLDAAGRLPSGRPFAPGYVREQDHGTWTDRDGDRTWCAVQRDLRAAFEARRAPERWALHDDPADARAPWGLGRWGRLGPLLRPRIASGPCRRGWQVSARSASGGRAWSHAAVRWSAGAVDAFALWEVSVSRRCDTSLAVVQQLYCVLGPGGRAVRITGLVGPWRGRPRLGFVIRLDWGQARVERLEVRLVAAPGVRAGPGWRRSFIAAPPCRSP